ncbi:HAD family hydrolase [Demequina zhanjiangensis]|uniref:HAD family phosphatase n=1 Tax=Demequina zhanjiangensis TaxID=3051659 RepID=A0ABT8G283_9MICO|nr:HAD family phosphatase [Demequina sp. SYSU T00b26]MDN4473122.1 HAD family phosphatase [Demequina sp. SYSU T00b26]
MNPHDSDPVAVLWDMDGTLIDSEPYWISAEKQLASRFGVEWTDEDGLSLVGRALPESAVILADRGIDLPHEQIVEFLVASVAGDMAVRVPWQEDARALLNEVVGAGIPCALVTMSYARLAQAFQARVPEAFQVVVSGDEVEHGKPDPEAYLLAAQRLGVDIERCVAIEDSRSGVRSAAASGARTIAVRRLTPLEEIEGVSRVASLEHVTVDTLRAVARGQVLDSLD